MSATSTPVLSRWEHRRLRLRWELQQLRDGKLRTWADYGHGRLESTVSTRLALEEHLAMVEQALNEHFQ